MIIPFVLVDEAVMRRNAADVGAPSHLRLNGRERDN